jgi:outer membrane lipoprotein SlyB
MFQKVSSYVSTLVLVLALAACAAPGVQPGQMEIRAGVVEQIINTELSSDHHSGVGAVVGGLAGLGVGSLIGAGTGRDVAMVLGAVGGAVAGHEIQKKYDKPIPAQQVIVRVGSGVLVSVTQPVNPTIGKGQRVFIEGSGEDARVVPR